MKGKMGIQKLTLLVKVYPGKGDAATGGALTETYQEGARSFLLQQALFAFAAHKSHDESSQIWEWERYTSGKATHSPLLSNSFGFISSSLLLFKLLFPTCRVTMFLLFQAKNPKHCALSWLLQSQLRSQTGFLFFFNTWQL